MSGYFTRERFGRPQFLAGLLLLAFLAQASWLVKSQWRLKNGAEESEGVRIAAGWRQWHGHGIAGAPYPDASYPDASAASFDHISDISSVRDGYDTEHSPLLPLVSAAPLLAMPERWWNSDSFADWGWLTRLPFLACGVFLGASLWYVARRLCGNHGGFVALALYCFSPAMIQASAVWHTEPEIVAAWGAFGAIFTAIAVAHTLYAPREVVLWNWRRIVLLGVSLAIATGSQFSMIIVVPLALAFLLYVAPVRRQAGLVIWVAACVAGFVLLIAVYFFHAPAFAQSMRHAAFWGATWRAFTVPGVYRQVATQLGRACPAFVLALPVALVTYATWPRTRYFGNTAPLLVALLFLVLGMAHPHVAGAGFLLASVPFLFLFVAGVLADLMETRYRPLVTAAILGLLAANTLWSLVALARVGQA
ncbi:MAG TPA: hypothetical protein VKR60_04860 [Candidatus Sulfotelmatobacter sp.]|nr:hypothetical protein [Candidatus Sulfotelmatobacter sp.]